MTLWVCCFSLTASLAGLHIRVRPPQCEAQGINGKTGWIAEWDEVFITNRTGFPLYAAPLVRDWEIHWRVVQVAGTGRYRRQVQEAVV